MKSRSNTRKTARQSPADTKRRIVDAAFAIAATKGFEHATTAEIAKRASVAEGSIYNHFRTKDDLLIYMVGEYSRAVLGGLSDAVAGESDPLRKIENLIAFHIRFFTQEGNIFQVIYGKRPGAKVQMARIIRVAIGPYVSLIEGIIREGIARGKFRNVNPRIAASVLLGGMQLTILQRFFNLADYGPDEAIEQIRNVYLGGLKSG
ncbi:TetR/AcrR family transcriptional regulator [Candidatus Poribacteria bacterium]|nr:TetR/AcrR family transcriptional regulator [Candidatus Poribacteria bacterium]